MKISNLTLFVEINNLELNFFVSSFNENEKLKISHKSNIFLTGLDGNKISNLEEFL